MNFYQKIFRVKKNLFSPRFVPIFSLVAFRIFFGILMFFLVLRFFLYDWIDSYFIKPQFFFSTFGLSFIQPLPGAGMYVVFGFLFVLSIGIAVGFFYRFCIISFFFLFTYFNLIDKTTYLNHYYLVSLLSFLLIFLPAHGFFALDVWRTKTFQLKVESWKIFILKLQLGFVYFFGGIAKWKSDWLLQAQPLKIWLFALSDMPFIGEFLSYNFTAYLFSYIGLFFDGTVFFFLYAQKTRLVAYFFVIVFHVLTWILFPIGMFPWLMIALTSIFFSPLFPLRIRRFLKKFFHLFFPIHKKQLSVTDSKKIFPGLSKTFLLEKWLFVLFFSFQLFLIFRHHLIENDVSWSEEGFRYSWHIMIIHKTATLQFFVYNYETNKKIPIEHKQYLTHRQNYMMSSQPDMILQFAHYLKKIKSKEMKNKNIGIMVDSFVSLNGHPSQLMIQPDVDLSKIHYQPFSLERSHYITDFKKSF